MEFFLCFSEHVKSKIDKIVKYIHWCRLILNNNQNDIRKSKKGAITHHHILQDSFWSKPKNVSPILSNTSSTKVLFEITKRSGISCLDLYHDILENKQESPFKSLTIKKELEEKGADFFYWIYKETPNGNLEKFIESYKWKELVKSGNFCSKTRKHLFENEKNKQFIVLKLEKCMDNDFELCETVKRKAIRIHTEEIKIFKSIKHENVIQILDHGFFNLRHWIALEYADLDNLTQNIKKYKNQKKLVPDVEIYKIIFDILRGLHFIHSQKIVHRDLKSDNILVFSEPTELSKKKFKIGDFDLSRTLNSFNKSSYCGSFDTMAPEIIKSEAYNCNADLWSLMCIIIHTATCKFLNPISLDTNALMLKINSIKNIHFKIIIHYLHKKKPEERPNSHELINFISNTFY